MGDAAHDLALHRTEWAKSSSGFSAWCCGNLEAQATAPEKCYRVKLWPPRPGTCEPWRAGAEKKVVNGRGARPPVASPRVFSLPLPADSKVDTRIQARESARSHVRAAAQPRRGG